MQLPKRVLSAILISLGFISFLPAARAAITPQGDVTPWTPPNPLNWTSSTAGYVGNTASGTLTVDAGSTLTSGTSSIGYGSSATGLGYVSGPARNGLTAVTSTSATPEAECSMSQSAGTVSEHLRYLGYKQRLVWHGDGGRPGLIVEQWCSLRGRLWQRYLNIQNSGCVSVVGTTMVGYDTGLTG